VAEGSAMLFYFCGNDFITAFGQSEISAFKNIDIPADIGVFQG
jgi:hypothetical protein